MFAFKFILILWFHRYFFTFFIFSTHSFFLSHTFFLNLSFILIYNNRFFFLLFYNSFSLRLTFLYRWIITVLTISFKNLFSIPSSLSWSAPSTPCFFYSLGHLSSVYLPNYQIDLCCRLQLTHYSFSVLHTLLHIRACSPAPLPSRLHSLHSNARCGSIGGIQVANVQLLKVNYISWSLMLDVTDLSVGTPFPSLSLSWRIFVLFCFVSFATLFRLSDLFTHLLELTTIECEGK